MALNIIRRICARLVKWFNERDEAIDQWRREDPDSYYAFMEEQQRNLRRGI